MADRDLRPVVALTRAHRTSDFDCGVESLNVFIRRFALRNQEKTHSARTFVVARDETVVGYFSLCAGAVRKEDVLPSLAVGQPDPVPVVLLGRLAVDLRESGRGLGTGLLQQAIRRVAIASKSIGVAAMLVHAIGDDGVQFYRHHGFTPFPLHARMLYLPVREILAEVGDGA